MTTAVRVRIAPSPSGHLHVGTARTAVYNWLFARHHGGKFILRIEDTDPERSRQEYTDSIQESLRWLGLDWDEGPYFQSQRTEIHARWVERLRASEYAYRCYCTPEELAAARKHAQENKLPLRYSGLCRDLSEEECRQREAEGRRPALRLRIPQELLVFADLVYGEQTRSGADIDDFVAVRADGRPTYNFACVIDDSEMQISHVIRGNDHLTNTFKQMLVYRALGVTPPEFAHLPLNLGADKRKISKREGATSIIEYRDRGFLPEAIVNFLALLGWSPGDNREIMTRDDMISAFTLERVNASNPVFDVQKLVWMNGEYIRALTREELLKRLTPVFVGAGLTTAAELEAKREWALAVVGSLQERLHLLTDAVTMGRFFFAAPAEYDAKGVRKHFSRPGVEGDLTLLGQQLLGIDPAGFNAETAEAALRGLAEQLERKPAELIHPLRLALTGMTAGPGLFDIIVLLGQATCRERIEHAIEFIRTHDPAQAGNE